MALCLIILCLSIKIKTQDFFFFYQPTCAAFFGTPRNSTDTAVTPEEKKKAPVLHYQLKTTRGI